MSTLLNPFCVTYYPFLHNVRFTQHCVITFIIHSCRSWRICRKEWTEESITVLAEEKMADVKNSAPRGYQLLAIRKIGHIDINCPHM